MKGYWTRHRMLASLVFGVVVALASSLLFMFPSIEKQAIEYNSQSLYRNSKVDFVVPEPSFEQISSLPGTNGINKVFPYFMTKTTVSVNGKSRTTNVLLSDQFQNLDITMYSDDRLIEKATEKYVNSILVDWRFCKDTSAKLGDAVTITINGSNQEYRIYAVYETNDLYDGGAVLVEMTAAQKENIMAQSKNSGYSGMYVSASNYSTCSAYLTSDYRPMGRLKNRDLFESDEQYQMHYDAIMSSGYANEITDFRAKENNKSTTDYIMIIIGAVLSASLGIIFNLLMARRGTERGYFAKNCVPKGIVVTPYYTCSFIFEVIVFAVCYAGAVAFRIKTAGIYISMQLINANLVIIPVAFIVAELIAMCVNKSMVKSLKKK